MSWCHRTVFRIFLNTGVRSGEITVVDANGERTYGGQPPGLEPLRARVEFYDKDFWLGRTTLSMGLGASYIKGRWDSDDLVSLLRIAARDIGRFDGLRRRVLPTVRFGQLRSPRRRRNTVAGSRRNIGAHYDLGNELFGAFLDESMTYSCAVFDRDGMTLAEAQATKLDRICQKLELGPGQHLLDVGCGWGALAIHAARYYGCRVTAATISREQYEYARARVEAEGLEDQVEILLRDYRELTGQYDKVTAIEVIEAVGWEFFPLFFQRLRELVAADGLVLLQAITTIDDRTYEVDKASRSFATTFIFPGGCLPSLHVIESCAAACELRTVHLEDISRHYVQTLRLWRERFNAAAQELGDLGYDTLFQRMWNLYLAYSEAGFAERRIRACQIMLAAPNHRNEPLPALASPLDEDVPGAHEKARVA